MEENLEVMFAGFIENMKKGIVAVSLKQREREQGHKTFIAPGYGDQ
jgi:hypothetical protein